jgi:putative DNA primase/helicase
MTYATRISTASSTIFKADGLRAGLSAIADKTMYVTWQLESNPDNPAKPRKVPYGIAGRRLTGSFADPSIVNQFMTLEQAIEWCHKRQHVGVGIAFFPKCGVVGLDVDHCRSKDTKQLTLNDAQKLGVAALQTYSFCEVSQSGEGLHFIALGDAETIRDAGCLELFGSANFLALTGRGGGTARTCPHDAIASVTQIVVQLKAEKQSARKIVTNVIPFDVSGLPSPTGVFRTNALIGQLPRSHGNDDSERVRSALSHLDPLAFRDYPSWRNIIWMVKDAIGVPGLELIDAWSQRDPSQYDRAALENVWNSDRGDEKAAAGIKVAGAGSLFKLARDSGWIDPDTSTSDSANDDAAPNATDLALARVFVQMHGIWFRFDHALRKWRQYRIGTWAICSMGEHVEGVKGCAPLILRMASSALQRESESVQGKKLQALALRAQSERGIKAALILAESDPSVAVSAEQFDSDPDMFNVANGIVHLTTGKLLQHSPGHLLSKQSPVEYDPGATCPLFLRFMEEISCGDPDWVNYMQRQLGYILCGRVQEEKLFFWFGDGRNGKSVLANIVRYVMGDYSVVSPITMFMVSSSSANAATPHLSNLPGKRLMLANETEAGARLSAQMLKVTVSTEHIAARPLYGSLFSFAPTHKVVMRGNHLPIIQECDEGTWRRIDLVPFDLKLTSAQCDPYLERKLLTEAPGILRWLIEGQLKWQSHGLTPAVRVRNASNAYRKNSDVIANWLADECLIFPSAEVEKAAAYRRYRNWAADEGLRVMAKKSLTRSLVERGFGEGRQSTGPRHEVYRGFRCK